MPSKAEALGTKMAGPPQFEASKRRAMLHSS
jgi:hypothetical protein